MEPLLLASHNYCIYVHSCWLTCKLWTLCIRHVMFQCTPRYPPIPAFPSYCFCALNSHLRRAFKFVIQGKDQTTAPSFSTYILLNPRIRPHVDDGVLLQADADAAGAGAACGTGGAGQVRLT